MNLRAVLKTFFRVRPDAPRIGYVPVLIVVVFFTLMGLEDEGFIGMLHFVGLFVIVVLQLRYRTLAGWLLLFGLCVVYGVAVIVTPDRQHVGEWAFFVACGFLPATALYIWRP